LFILSHCLLLFILFILSHCLLLFIRSRSEPPLHILPQFILPRIITRIDDALMKGKLWG
jgi:hypothetical protein